MRYSTWHLSDLAERAARPYFEFLDQPSMSAGLYSLPVAVPDSQSPHQEDEVYYILEGKADLRVEKDVIPTAAGSIVYVRAGAPHRFDPITADLSTLVLFSSSTPDRTAEAWEAFDLAELVIDEPRQNIWNQFLSRPTLRMGLYSLPFSVGGDDPLVHTFDELNVVVSGRGVFRVEDHDVPIEPGTIMFVPATQPHSFHSLEADLEVLIFWEGSS